MNKRILFLVDNLSAGGAGRAVARIANALSQKGYPVYVATMSSRIKTYPLDKSVTFVPLTDSEEKSSLTISKRIKLIKKVCIDYKVSLIISFMTELSIYAILSAVGEKWKVISCERNDPNNDPTEKRIRVLRKILYPFSDGFVFQTKDARDFFPKNIRSKSKVIYNPLSDDIPDMYNGIRRKAIVSVGRLNKQKNFPNLIRAFGMISDDYPDYHLEIYGEGALLNDLRSLCERMNLKDKVLFMGQREDVLTCIRDASIFVLPSDYEGMSNALLEAMALGLPVISTDHPIGGAKAVIHNRENGLLVPTNDSKALALGMRELLNNQTFGIKMSNQAITVRKDLSIQNIALQWEEYIDHILGR